LYAYVIVTDTVGNLINMFKPIRFYNYGAGITNSDKLINYIPKFTVDKQGYFYFTWSPFFLNSSHYKNNLYNNVNYKCRLANDRLITLTDAESQLLKYDLNGNFIWSRKQNYF